MIAVLVALTAGFAYLGVAVVARHRAQSAADLAALAGAGRLAHGGEAACAEAAAVATAMGTNIARCSIENLDVVVAVDVTVALGRFGVGPARAVARAGPVDGAG